MFYSFTEILLLLLMLAVPAGQGIRMSMASFSHGGKTPPGLILEQKLNNLTNCSSGCTGLSINVPSVEAGWTMVAVAEACPTSTCVTSPAASPTVTISDSVDTFTTRADDSATSLGFHFKAVDSTLGSTGARTVSVSWASTVYYGRLSVWVWSGVSAFDLGEVFSSTAVPSNPQTVNSTGALSKTNEVVIGDLNTFNGSPTVYSGFTSLGGTAAEYSEQGTAGGAASLTWNTSTTTADYNGFILAYETVNSSGSAPSGYDLTLSTTGTGTGTLTPSPSGTSCGTNCYHYSSGTSVSVGQSASTGSSFIGWSGDCTGSAGCSVTMNSAQAVTATFNLTSGGGTIAATDCSESAVATALASVTSDGTTVTIPAGNCTWTTALHFTPSYSIVVEGAGAQYSTAGGSGTAGTDQTIIADGVGNQFFYATTTSGKSLRITGIDFTWDPSLGTYYSGAVYIDGNSSSFRLDHCHFDGIQDKSLVVAGSVTGVADHNYFTSSGNEDIYTINGHNWTGGTDGGAGDESWTDTDHWGTAQFMYYEDNLLDRSVDCWQGGRYVFRYNTDSGSNAGMVEHGTNSAGTNPSARERGCRAAEIYNNSFTRSSAFYELMTLESGAMLFWGNTITNYTVVIHARQIRANNSTYTEYATPSGWGYCGTAFNGTGSNWDENTSTSTGYACLDQVGRGAGDLLTGSFPNVLNNTTGTIAWPNQALDPLYIFDNTFNSTGYSGSAYVVPENSSIADNRDYYQQFGTYGESGTFDGTKGVGQGSSIPTIACTQGVGYWDTGNQTLYVCNGSSAWTAYYTPYAYPHP